MTRSNNDLPWTGDTDETVETNEMAETPGWPIRLGDGTLVQIVSKVRVDGVLTHVADDDTVYVQDTVTGEFVEAE